MSNILVKGVLQMRPLSEADLLLVVYVLVDDWFQAKGKALWQAIRTSDGRSRPGPTPGSRSLSPSEMLTLVLAIDLLDFDSERRFIAHLRANHANLFSAPIPDHTWLNRAGRDLASILEPLRAYLAKDLGVLEAAGYLIDTTPVEVVGYKRSKRRSDFAGSASYGYCASLNKHYFGYKLVVLCDFTGLPVCYELVPANTDERKAAEAVLPWLLDPERLDRMKNEGANKPGSVVIGDKGFIGKEWAIEQMNNYGACIITPKRRNQREQWENQMAQNINHVRQRIETLNGMLKHGARGAGRTLAKTVGGLASRIAARFAALTARLWLKKFWAVDTLNLLWDTQTP